MPNGVFQYGKSSILEYGNSLPFLQFRVDVATPQNTAVDQRDVHDSRMLSCCFLPQVRRERPPWRFVCPQ